LLSGKRGVALVHYSQHEIDPSREAACHGINIHAAKHSVTDRSIENTINDGPHFCVTLTGKLENLLLIRHLFNAALILVLLLVQVVECRVDTLDKVAVRWIKGHLALPVQGVGDNTRIKIKVFHTQSPL